MWPILVNSFAFVLAICYSCISLITCFQICKIIYYRHNVFHFQFVFLALCFCWGIVRAVFWLFVPWSDVGDVFMNGSGLIIQFWTFSLLVLYFIQMICKIQENWNEKRVLVICLFFFINFLFIGAFIGTGIGLYYTQADWMQDALAFFIAFMYLVLSGLLSFFGWRLMTLISNTKTKIPFLKGRTWLAALTFVLFLVFFSRAIKDLLTGLHIGIISSDPTKLDLKDQIATFSLMFIWDIVPAILVILIFWHIPAPNTPNTIIEKGTSRGKFPDFGHGKGDSQEFIFSPNHLSIQDEENSDSINSTPSKVQFTSPKKFGYKTKTYHGYNTNSQSEK